MLGYVFPGYLGRSGMSVVVGNGGWIKQAMLAVGVVATLLAIVRVGSLIKTNLNIPAGADHPAE